MGVYDRQIATAKRLIAAKGQAVVWRNITDAVKDANKPWNDSAKVPVDHNVSMVFLPPNKSGAEYQAYIKNTEVPQGMVQALMAGGLNFVPLLKDVVVRNGVILDVESIDPLSPNGEIIMYTVVLKL